MDGLRDKLVVNCFLWRMVSLDRVLGLGEMKGEKIKIIKEECLIGFICIWLYFL